MIFVYIVLGILALTGFCFLFLWGCSLFVNPRREYDRDSPFYRAILVGVSWVILRLLRVKIHVSGMEKMPEEDRPLFVCNHRSNYDPIITWCVFDHWKPAFVSKEENFHIPIFGRIIRRCCFTSIDRVNPRCAMKTINRMAALLRREEISVAVYPEGTRSKTGELLDFHNGMFKIAQKAGKPIVVLAIAGTEQIAKNFCRLRASHVYLDVLEVIPIEEVCVSGTAALGERIRNLFIEKLRRE